MNLNTMKKKTITVAVAFAVAAGAMLADTAPFAPVSTVLAQEKTASLPDFSKLVEENGKAVVSIQVTKTPRAPRTQKFGGQMPRDEQDLLKRFGIPFGGMPFDEMPPRQGRMPKRGGQGSGFIISKDGLILTNHHVIDGADEIKVHLPDNRDFTAKVLGSDAKTDIAVIKIDAKDLPAVKIGKSENVKVGEWVAAIGAPFGLENTVTSGIVSAKSRNLPSDQFVPFIQTDAAVNPGNSGGPLFNMKGEVIGINSQIFSTSGGFMGLSFAIPIDLAMQIKDDLIKDGKVSRGRIGVVIQNLTPELANTFGLSKTEGSLVSQIDKDGPAAKAGVQEGDVIIEFAGKPVADPAELSRAVASTKPNQTSSLKLIREGKPVELKITVEELGDSGSAFSFQQGAKIKGRLGVTVRPLNDQEKKKNGSGLVVVEVGEGSAAEEAGIQPNDIIISVTGKKITNFDEFKKAVDNAKDSLAILIDRNGQRQFLNVKLEEQKKSEKKDK